MAFASQQDATNVNGQGRPEYTNVKWFMAYECKTVILHYMHSQYSVKKF